PPKTFQLISTLLSAGTLVGGGTLGSARETHSAQRQRTFHCSIPVTRLSFISCSFACCETLMCSIDIRLPPFLRSSLARCASCRSRRHKSDGRCGRSRDVTAQDTGP